MSERVSDAAPAVTGTQWEIAAAGHRAVVTEVGATLRSYAAHGRDVVDGFAADELPPACHGQVLAPWPNRIRDGRYSYGGREYQLPLTEPAKHNAIHGLVGWLRWTPEETAADAVTLACELPAQPGYPWWLRLRVRWSVSADGLRCDAEALTPGPDPAPWGFSVHPYLAVPGVPVDELRLTVPAATRIVADDRLLPIGGTATAGTAYDFTRPRRVGDLVLDTTFGDVTRDPDGGSRVRLEGPGGDGVTVWGDAAFGWWQVFTSDTLHGERHRRAVAVEPMTCPPDAFRSGRDLITLEPGRPWRASWGVRP